jgi:hypothetical protein
MGVIVFVATFLIVVVIPQLFEWLRRRSLNSKKVLKQRTTRIHQWLITKVNTISLLLQEFICSAGRARIYCPKIRSQYLYVYVLSTCIIM